MDQQDKLERMYRQAKDLNLGLLLSGLTILVKDTATYLTAAGIDNQMAEGFRLAYLNMLNDNRYYWENFGSDLYLPLNVSGLPEGFASNAARCHGDLEELINPDLDLEWLRAPGWFFFQSYSKQRIGDILHNISLEELIEAYAEGKNPYEQDSQESRHHEAHHKFCWFEALTKQLAGSEGEHKSFWYPVMLYMALLIHKTNYITLA